MLALIPAKGSSSRVQGKNFRDCFGKPLIYWTLAPAIEVLGKNNVYVSTECERIIEYCINAGVNVWSRPKNLAKSDTTTAEVIGYHLKHNIPKSINAIITLQPTSPLRSAASLKNAIKLWKSCSNSSLVSVVKVPHIYNKHDQFMLLDGEKLNYQQPEHNGLSQQKPVFYVRNGAAIYISHRTLLEQGKLYDEFFQPFEMEVAESIDIDEEIDFLIAEFLLARRDELL